MVRNLLRVVWALSGLAALYVLFSTYGNVNEGLLIPGSSSIITRDLYFYGGAAIILVINLLFILLKSAVKQADRTQLVFANRSFWLTDKEHQEAHRQILWAWIYAWASAINFALVLMFLVFYEVNIANLGNYRIPMWYYTVGVAMFVTLILPVFRLQMKSINLLDNRTK